MEVMNDIKKAEVGMSSGQRRTAMDYYWMGKYDIMTTANEDSRRLIPQYAFYLENSILISC
ncbi:unnamed protein product [Acanthoscelides obtectus]|uniref:Uncharacterized protein n=1 Tax=Acanthoscelides obtectus TaxID=200917 RepID=A0A9P0PMS5_ACAOB|nr:unnamed protein product [Acanthoscelides obtectus]CAK1680997.1 hypothetical protein AOBTE_LOCUS32971 [Acanthoscelides obtectus]